MMKAESKKRVLAVVLTVAMTVGVMTFTPVKVMAAEKFDPVFYLMNYPDVGVAFGANLNADVLYEHYITCGRTEGRKPYAGAAGGEAVNGMKETALSEMTGEITPLNELPHYDDIKDAMSDEEFAELYNDLVPLMMLVKQLDQQEQVLFVTFWLADSYDTGEVLYSNAFPHFSNPYGLFYYGAADDSGCTRAAGLMFEMLGIEWEHVVMTYGAMEMYHWSVVTVDGQRYTVDPYMKVLEPEVGGYSHSAVDAIISLFG